MKIIALMFVYSAVVLSTVNAQVEISPKSGSFEEFYPWGDGYLGLTQKLAYAVAAKTRNFEYYNENGDLQWETEVEPFNHAVHLVLSENSDFAYFVNSVYTNTALLEKKSKGEFLRLYMVNRNGELTNRSFKFEGEFECLVDGKYDLEISYMGAFDDGLAIVTNDPKVEGQWYLFTISNSFEIQKTKLDFKWNEQDWEDNKVSRLNFFMNSNDLSIIQVTSQENKYNFEIHTYSLDDLSQVTKVDNTFSLDNIGTDILGYNNRYHRAFSTYDVNMVSYFRVRNKGEYTAYIPKLGALFDYQFTNNRLYVIGNLYESANDQKMHRPKGLCYFEMSLETDVDVKNPETLIFPRKSRKEKIYECSILLGEDVLCFMDYRKSKGCVGLVNGETFELPKKASSSVSISLMLNLVEEGEFPSRSYAELFNLESAYVISGSGNFNAASGADKMYVKKSPK